MGFQINISSILLFIPCIFHRTYLSNTEHVALFSLFMISALFHSSRERDLNTNDSLCLSLQTKNLYKLDFLQIQMGLIYLVLNTLPIHIVLYLLVLEVSNSFTVAIMYYHLIRTVFMIYQQTNALHLVGLLVGILLAKYGYRGTSLYCNKKTTLLKGTPWSEWHKCFWHGGMGIIITIVIEYRYINTYI